MITSWFWRVFAWLSQGINVIFLGGHEDQTVSARAHGQQDELIWGLVRLALNAVFFWQADHCLTSYLRDRDRSAQMMGF